MLLKIAMFTACRSSWFMTTKTQNRIQRLKLSLMPGMCCLDGERKEFTGHN